MAEPVDPHAPDAPGPLRRRSWLRLVLLSTIGILYVLSVPWYRDTDAELRIIFGLPDWVVVSLACYVGIAVLNAIAWLQTDVDDDAGDEFP